MVSDQICPLLAAMFMLKEELHLTSTLSRLVRNGRLLAASRASHFKEAGQGSRGQGTPLCSPRGLGLLTGGGDHPARRVHLPYEGERYHLHQIPSYDNINI